MFVELINEQFICVSAKQALLNIWQKFLIYIKNHFWEVEHFCCPNTTERTLGLVLRHRRKRLIWFRVLSMLPIGIICLIWLKPNLSLVCVFNSSGVSFEPGNFKRAWSTPWWPIEMLFQLPRKQVCPNLISVNWQIDLFWAPIASSLPQPKYCVRLSILD